MDERDRAIALSICGADLWDFARGIYPPLLESEGVAAAISQQTLDGPIAISVDAEGVGRQSREVEAAVYFAVLEAIQNAAKHADATSVAVVFTESDHAVGFEVRDDGRGFDVAEVMAAGGLRGLFDRVDTVRGKVGVRSQPGSGTVVSGSVPTGGAMDGSSSMTTEAGTAMVVGAGAGLV